MESKDYRFLLILGFTASQQKPKSKCTRPFLLSCTLPLPSGVLGPQGTWRSYSSNPHLIDEFNKQVFTYLFNIFKHGIHHFS